MAGAVALAVSAIPRAGFAAPAPPAPPANDSMAGATSIDTLPFHTSEDMLLATKGPDEPNFCGIPMSDGTVWFRYAPAADGTVLFDTIGTGSNTMIAIFTGDSPASLQDVSCDWTSSTAWSRVDVPVTAGTTYWVEVGAAHRPLVFNASASSALSGRVTDRSGAPLHACVVAHDRSGDEPGFAFTNAQGEYRVVGLPAGEQYFVEFRNCSGGAEFVDRWYAGKPDMATADPVTTSADHEVTGVDGVVGTPPSFVGSVVDDHGQPAVGVCVEADNGDQFSYTSVDESGNYRLFVAPGAPYRISFGCNGWYAQAWYGGADAETATPVAPGADDTVTPLDTVTLHKYTTPSNDNFANAAVLAPDAVDSREVFEAWTEPTEPTCGANTYSTVWYRVNPTFTGDLEVDAALGSHRPVAVAVYQGDTLDHLTTVTCFDRDPASGIGAVVPVTAGQSYAIQVNMEWPDPDQLTVRVSQARARVDRTYDQATTPCAVACPYWTADPTGRNQPTDNEAACQPTPTAPPGSWQDVRVTVPAEVDGVTPRALAWHLDPQTDYDGFVCRVNPDKEGRYFVASSANSINSSDCPLPSMGCAESVVAPVTPGDELVLRVYNWSDTAPVSGHDEFVG